jgi:hypothetical protein
MRRGPRWHGNWRSIGDWHLQGACPRREARSTSNTNVGDRHLCEEPVPTPHRPAKNAEGELPKVFLNICENADWLA